MAPIPKRKTERAPAVDKLIKPAGGIALALLGYFVLQGLQAEVSTCTCGLPSICLCYHNLIDKARQHIHGSFYGCIKSFVNFLFLL